MMRNKLQIDQNPYIQKYFVVLLAMMIGGFIRLGPVLSADYPIKDGGLFFIFVEQIQQLQFHLPITIPFNGIGIPFVYPPFSFYITAFLSQFFGISTVALIKVLPAIFSIITIPVFYLLASTLLDDDFQSAVATISFALLPTAVDFMIVGGGLPRALGFIFAILALRQTWILFSESSRRNFWMSVLWVSLTILSHPVVSWFLAFSLLIIYFFKEHSRKGFFILVKVGLWALIVTSPWWLTVISRHGISPIISAMQATPMSWTAYLAPLLFIQTNEPYLHIQGLLALIGLFICLSKRNYLFPAWLGAVFLFEPRLMASYSIIPTALLVGIGIDFLVKSLSLARTSDSTSSLTDPASADKVPFNRTTKAMLGFFLIYALVSSFISTPREYLSQDNREAIAWIKENIPAGSQFLVISGIYGAGEDYIAEWFPALTESISLSTAQGMEWSQNQIFLSTWKNHDDLQGCIREDARCLETWEENNLVDSQYIYLVKSNGENSNLFTSLMESGYSLAFENTEVVVFARSP